jgi:hypothetical protein
VVPLIPLPMGLLLLLAVLAEWVCWYLAAAATAWAGGGRRRGPWPPMTRLEAFKCGRSHTLSIAKAERVLGYRPLQRSADASARAAQDFARKRKGR